MYTKITRKLPPAQFNPISVEIKFTTLAEYATFCTLFNHTTLVEYALYNGFDSRRLIEDMQRVIPRGGPSDIIGLDKAITDRHLALCGALEEHEGMTI